MSTTLHTILYHVFFNFAHVLPIVWRCACAFHIILALIFHFYLLFWTFVIFWPQMFRQWVPCDCNFSYNACLFETWHIFCRVCRSASALDMIFRFIFTTFSTLSFSYLRFYESYRLWVLFKPNFSCIIWENAYALDEIPILISSTWNKHYFYFVCVGGGGGGGGGRGRCDINFTKVWYIFLCSTIWAARLEEDVYIHSLVRSYQ